MKIFFRTDAGSIVGFGHIFRCISLANQLKKTTTSIDIQFIINQDEHSKKILNSKGYDYIVLEEGKSEESFLLSNLFIKKKAIFIFDTPRNYSEYFISTLSKYNKTAMIQCYSDARFYSNLSIYPAGHLDTRFLKDPRWSNSKARLKYGIDYCLLNEEISNIKPREAINTPPQVVSVVAGGADPTSSLLTIFNWLTDFNVPGIKIYCQYGLGANYKNRIKDLKYKEHIEFCEFSLNLCAKSDLVICAFGVTVYEIAYLNIPMLTYGHTYKHANASRRYSERYKSTIHMGLLDEITKEHFLMILRKLYFDSNILKKMQCKAKNLVDGKGIKRVADLITELTNEF